MDIVNNIEKVKTPYKNGVVTIGNFDGVHKGHQALLKAVVSKAKEVSGTSIAITFEPHPARVLGQNSHPNLITLYEQKVELISRAGIDVLICIPFTKEFASQAAKAFLEDILIKRIGIKAIVVGKDYAFGKNCEGDINFLKEYSKNHGYEVIVVNWEKQEAGSVERISSTIIREVIQAGNVEDVVELLGRYYQIRGTVVSGRNRGGKLLGFPTANINLQDELCPKMGVYAVIVECDSGKYPGVANIGYSPTFDDHIFTVEVHILDFDDDIYDQKIRVNFVSRLRDEKKFANINELSGQIKADIKKAREIFSDILPEAG